MIRVDQTHTKDVEEIDYDTEITFSFLLSSLSRLLPVVPPVPVLSLCRHPPPTQPRMGSGE